MRHKTHLWRGEHYKHAKYFLFQHFFSFVVGRFQKWKESEWNLFKNNILKKVGVAINNQYQKSVCFFRSLVAGLQFSLGVFKSKENFFVLFDRTITTIPSSVIISPSLSLSFSFFKFQLSSKCRFAVWYSIYFSYFLLPFTFLLLSLTSSPITGNRVL